MRRSSFQLPAYFFRSEMSFSPSMVSARIVSGSVGMFLDKRIRWPRTAAVDAALVLPATSILLKRRFQLFAIGAANEEGSVPHQAGLPGAGLSARTRCDGKFGQHVDEVRHFFVQLAGTRLQHLGFAFQIVGAAGCLRGDTGF